MDAMLVALAPHRVTEVDLFSSGVQMIFLCTISTGTVQRYAAGRQAPVKHQKIVDGPVVPVFASAVDLN